MIARRIITASTMDSGTEFDNLLNASALQDAQRRIRAQDRELATANAELNLNHAELNRYRAKRQDHHREATQLRQTIARLEADIATLRDQHTQREATFTARVEVFELRLRERTRRSAGQGVIASESASVFRYRQEAENARALLNTRSEALAARRASLLEHDRDRDEIVRNLRIA